MRVAKAARARKSDGVAVIGLGNWGTSLAAALEDAGLLAERVHGRERGTRPHLEARLLWLCVPDAAIARTAEWMVEQRRDLQGQMVVHSSGALDRTVLMAAEQAGARTASVHPMMSFPTRRRVPLEGTRFGVETADAATRRALFAVIRQMGGKPFAIEGGGKAMYHAGAMFGSPLLVAALAAGVQCMHEAGIEEREALALLGPMAAATVANVQRQGLARSFSGPLARGDAATVKLHREALAGHPLQQASGGSRKPGSGRSRVLVAQVYDALAALAAKELPSADRAAIRRALDVSAGQNAVLHRKKQ